MRFGLNRATLIFVGFLLIAGYFLWAEHAAHIMLAVPYLPWLLILLCPLMHVFMHGGHGHGHGGHHQDKTKSENGGETERQHSSTGHSPLPTTRLRDE